MKNNICGSTWKKCDLHFHTPSSFDHQDKSQTPEEIVGKFISEGISIVAITDHYFIDSEFILKLREEAKNKITFFPGVEIRSTLGKDAVHLIAIFSDELDLSKLSNELSAFTHIYRNDLQNDNLMQTTYTDYREFINFVKDREGLISIHAGSGRSGSIENVSNIDECVRLLKTDLLRDSVDMLDVIKLKHEKDYKEIVFKSTQITKPIISGSDNHHIENYEFKLPCWLKCDATFNGLLQVTLEPHERVFLGEKPLQIERIEKSKTNYISSLKINKKDNSKLDTKWFDNCSLNFNPGLVSIIGKKGNGKSALADILALLCNSHQDKNNFSFLNSKKFCNKKNGKASHFCAQLSWLSGNQSNIIGLDDCTNSAIPERAKYIPQSFLEDLCNDIEGKDLFQKELQEVIFKHIPEEEKLESDNFMDLIKYVTSEKYDSISEIKNRLDKINKEIIELEDAISDENITATKNVFSLKLEELKSIIARKPAKILQPDQNLKQKEDQSKINIQIHALEDRNREIKEKHEKQKKELSKFRQRVVKLEKLKEKISNFESQFNKLKIELSDFKDLELNFDSIISFTVDYSLLDKMFTDSNNKLSKLSNSISDYNINENIDKIKILHEKLDEPNRIYQNYMMELSSWKEELKNIVGDINTPETIRFINNKIKKNLEIPSKLNTLYADRIKLSEKIFSKKIELKNKYKQFYKSVQEFIKNHPLSNNNFELKFNVEIVESEFITKFLSMIDQSKSGSFYGKEPGKNKLNSIIIQKNFNELEQAKSFLIEIIGLLNTDNRNGVNQNNISLQLKKGINILDLYNFLYSFDYLNPIYNLSWAGKELDQLSPGERGNLLLIFYLLIDTDKKPLILDQPEDNLDNETVFKTLGPCIRDAKKRRQIIMVTHNPNLAVACDSEQIIHAEINKEKNFEVTYTSGSIENNNINKLVVNVLEGTRPAFDRRNSTYR